ncbi:MAG: hypothetical protein HGA85_02750 [Nanoarchaeota archaeon]|nr:hypothetical protein [Nanoarchaeota archaeon]
MVIVKGNSDRYAYLFIISIFMFDMAWHLADNRLPYGDSDFALRNIRMEGMPFTEKLKYIGGENPFLQAIDIFSKIFSRKQIYNPFFLALCLFATYHIGKHLYGNIVGTVATIVLSSYPIFLEASRMTDSGFYLLSVISLSFLFLLRSYTLSDTYVSCAYGIATGIAALIRQDFWLFCFPPFLMMILLNLKIFDKRHLVGIASAIACFLFIYLPYHLFGKMSMTFPGFALRAGEALSWAVFDSIGGIHLILFLLAFGFFVLKNKRDEEVAILSVIILPLASGFPGLLVPGLFAIAIIVSKLLSKIEAILPFAIALMVVLSMSVNVLSLSAMTYDRLKELAPMAVFGSPLVKSENIRPPSADGGVINHAYADLEDASFIFKRQKDKRILDILQAQDPKPGIVTELGESDTVVVFQLKGEPAEELAGYNITEEIVGGYEHIDAIVFRRSAS